MHVLYLWGTALPLLVIAWNAVPLLIIPRLPGVPTPHCANAMLCMLGAAGRGLACLLPDLLAPVVVPVALLQTPREAESLPRWARWWDNDASINGDQAEGAETYYAPGHDRRSFWARYVWLGLRNRASRLALDLGHRYQAGEYEDAENWGDPATGRDHEGWTLNRRGPVYQLYLVKRLGRLCFRMNYGFKVWAGEGDRRPVAMVVNISASLLAWQGAK